MNMISIKQFNSYRICNKNIEVILKVEIVLIIRTIIEVIIKYYIHIKNYKIYNCLKYNNRNNKINIKKINIILIISII